MTITMKSGGADSAPADHDSETENPVDDEGSGLLRIGEMARKFGVSMRTLRFYEDKDLIAPLRVGNTRLYRKREVARLKLIMLGRRVGFSLRDVKQLMDMYEPRGSNVRQLQVALEKSERQLARLHDQRASISEAIDELQSVISTVQGRLDKRGSKTASV